MTHNAALLFVLSDPHPFLLCLLQHDLGQNGKQRVFLALVRCPVRHKVYSLKLSAHVPLVPLQSIAKLQLNTTGKAGLRLDL